NSEIVIAPFDAVNAPEYVLQPPEPVTRPPPNTADGANWSRPGRLIESGITIHVVPSSGAGAPVVPGVVVPDALAASFRSLPHTAASTASASASTVVVPRIMPMTLTRRRAAVSLP